jgi:protein TonB
MSGPDVTPKPSLRLWVFAALGALALHLGCAALAVANLQTTDFDDDVGAPGLEIGLELAAPQSAPTDLPAGPDANAAAASAATDEQKAEFKPSDLPKDTPTETENPDRLVSLDRAQKPQQETPDKPTEQAMQSTESAAQEATATPSPETARKSERSVTLTEGSGESKQRVRTTWRKQLVAHINRKLRYPSDRERQAAEVIVNFSLDRAGHIVSTSIVKGSGDAAFDAAALSTLKRSDPVPPPPPLIADEGLSFTLPVIFTR